MIGNIFETVKECIKDNELISPGDRVLLGLSGGKDSMTCLSVLNGIKEELGFYLGAVFVAYPMMDLPVNIKEYLKEKNIPLFCVSIDKKIEKINCSMCSKERRKSLLLCAKNENYNKIALAHNFEDNCETVLMNLFTGKGCEKLSPKRVYFDNWTLIRPMLYVREKKIISFAERNALPVCKNTCENLPNCGRIKIRGMLKELCSKYPDIYDNILKD